MEKKSFENWNIGKRKISDLIPNANNPRTITKEKLKKLKSQIERLGFHNPIKLKHDGTILGGNQRQKILLSECPGDWEVIVVTPPREMSEEEYKEIIITDNISEGEWDTDKLANECDIIINRWQKFTGKDAILEQTGIKYNEMLKLKEEMIPRSC